MISRERITRTLEHKEPDKIPIDFGGTDLTGMHVSIISKLRQQLGFSDSENRVKVIEPYQMLGEIDEDLRAALGIDTIALLNPVNVFGFENNQWKPWKTFDGTEVLVPGKFNTVPEANGEVLMYAEGDKSYPPCAKMPKNGFYFDSIERQKPINDQNLRLEDNTEDFNLLSEADIDFYKEQVGHLCSYTDYAIISSFSNTSFGDISEVPGPMLKDPKGIRGIEEWYISTLSRTEFVYSIFEKQLEIGLANLKRLYEAVGNKVDVVVITGTDFGAQNSQFISTEMYCKLYKPFHLAVNDWIHDNTGWKTFIHSCGAIFELIPEFIDAGFDILNPVQISAANMDPGSLKKEFGQEITFWGGGVDTQKTLPFGKPDEVYRQVTSLCESFAPGGGFVFNTIHNIQCNTPIENVMAMFKAIKDISGES